jgi:outer membrane protein insertion porin family/translocation and assembly module TamA
MIVPHPTITRRGGANTFPAGWARHTTGAVRHLLLLLLSLLLTLGPPAEAAEPAQGRTLSPRIRWRVGTVRIEGADHISERRLRPLLTTRPRSWFTPWKARPRFDREGLEDDVVRVVAYYRGHGYYRAHVTYSLDPDRKRETVDVTIAIEEGPAVVVSTVEVTVADAPSAEVRAMLNPKSLVPLEPGDVFDEARYDEGRVRLLGRARSAHFARAQVTKRARVDVPAGTATIGYTVTLGPPSFLGPVTVDGLTRVEPTVVLREVAFEEGAPFDPALLERTRRNLLRLHLFRAITLVEKGGSEADVPITIRVAEGPWREIRAGVGYDTEEQVRGLLSWRTYNFFGDARQLGVTARASTIRRSIAADLLQPHWPVQKTRTRLLALFEDDEQDSFSVTRARLSPRLEWAPTPSVLAFAAYRIERDHLTSVNGAVERALAPEATPDYATLSGMNFGVDWNRTDDLLNPKRGFIVTTQVDPVGSVFGGDSSFLRLQGTLRTYVPLAWRFLLATRLRVGTIEPIDGSHEIPIWERFFAGGVDSVRGYARWRVGPLAGDDPLGGRSLTDMSLELRRPITQAIAVTTFIDAGQLSLRSFDPPTSDFQKGVGAGLQYATPIGPIRLDLGFPLDRQGDDAAFQVYVSVGQAF